MFNSNKCTFINTWGQQKCATNTDAQTGTAVALMEVYGKALKCLYLKGHLDCGTGGNG